MSKLERLKKIHSTAMPYSIDKVPSWQEGIGSHPLIGIIILIVLVLAVFALGFYFAWKYSQVIQKQQRYLQIFEEKGEFY